MDTAENFTIEVGYIPEMDRTVIFKEMENSTECVGWYYGRPDTWATKEYMGKSLKAVYTMGFENTQGNK